MKQHIYHLSHIDLDGYGCQYLTTKCFDKIECYNANYGPEVTARLEEMVKKIEQDKFIHGDKKNTAYDWASPIVTAADNSHCDNVEGNHGVENLQGLEVRRPEHHQSTDHSWNNGRQCIS
jgi:oligoribonuclease NrnB/cAMP/cGMP phosphodiesterase (DHH superfamily)